MVIAMRRSETVERLCGLEDLGGRVAPCIQPGAALLGRLLKEAVKTGIQVAARTAISIDVFPGLRIDQRIEW